MGQGKGCGGELLGGERRGCRGGGRGRRKGLGVLRCPWGCDNRREGSLLLKGRNMGCLGAGEECVRENGWERSRSAREFFPGLGRRV